MQVDPADTAATQRLSLHQAQNLPVGGNQGLGQRRKRGQQALAVGRHAAGQFANDKRVHEHHTGSQQGRELPMTQA